MSLPTSFSTTNLAASISLRLGHLLLSSFEQEQEDEADWLSGTLLVPRTGLVVAYRSVQDPRILANGFRVSVDMLNWRLRMTGVATHARRARNWSR